MLNRVKWCVLGRWTGKFVLLSHESRSDRRVSRRGCANVTGIGSALCQYGLCVVVCHHNIYTMPVHARSPWMRGALHALSATLTFIWRGVEPLQNIPPNDDFLEISIQSQCHGLATTTHNFNPLTAKLFNLNFHPLEVVDRVSEWKLFRFDKMEVNYFQILLVDVTFYL